MGGIAEDEARIEERKTGIESPNCRGLSRLAHRDCKERRETRTRTKFSAARPQLRNQRLHLLGWRHDRGGSPGPKLDCARRLDIVHCPLNIFERYPDVCEELAMNWRTNPNINTRLQIISSLLDNFVQL